MEETKQEEHQPVSRVKYNPRWPNQVTVRDLVTICGLTSGVLIRKFLVRNKIQPMNIGKYGAAMYSLSGCYYYRRDEEKRRRKTGQHYRVISHLLRDECIARDIWVN